MSSILFFIFLFNIAFAEPPKVVVFDYGGVVAKVDRRPILHFLSKNLHVSYKKIKKDFASDKLYEAFEQPIGFWEKYAHKSLSPSWSRELENCKLQVIREIPGMRELIEKIKAQGIQVALLSNTNWHRGRFIEKMGGYNLFDPILLSCHLGVKKPKREIYQVLLEHLACPAKDCLFIDNREENIRAGKKSGLDGIVFTSVEELQEELKKREITL